MSKASELRLIRGQRSADAAINYHHRSGDSEGSGGSMLDFYAQEESAEEAYLEEQEESAREVFSRAFRLYLKKTLTGKERKFLSRVLSGKEKPQEVGRALGVKWFEYMQEIRRKAFNNAEAFGRVVQLSGWSRAEIFAGAVFGRLKELERRGAAEELPREKKQAQDGGHASTIIRPFDDEFRTLLENTIDDAADDSGWASLGDVGSVLSKKMPDFDPRNYGYKKLSLLVRALSDAVDMKTEQQRVYVRNRVG